MGAGETGKATILVVDDEPSVLNVLHGILVHAGYHVVAVDTPAKALEVFETFTEPVDLLLTDVVMPGMNGTELADRLARRQSGLKVLLIAGMPDHAVVKTSVAAHGYFFMPKPFLPKQLVAKVRDILQEPCSQTASPAQ